MTTSFTLDHMRAVLDDAGQRYQQLTLDDGFSILVTQRGGRIFGPFLNGGGTLCWINPVFSTAEMLQAAFAAGEWNVGGERIWIAPEVQYNTRDRHRFFDTLIFPAQMDPANYAFDASATGVRLRTQMTLEAYNLGTGTTTLTVEHHIRTGLPNPLRALGSAAALMEGVAYTGYLRSVHLATTPDDRLHSETWCLMQLNPGGTLYIPTTMPDAYVSPYFGTPAEDTQTVVDGAYRIAITGRQEYKVGYKSAAVTGRMGYLNTLPDGSGYLLIRAYFNNPSAVYAEEPPGLPGVNGHSVHVYNGGGGFGEMGEMEATGQTIGGTTGVTSITEDFILWAFSGPLERLKPIGRALLGITL